MTILPRLSLDLSANLCGYLCLLAALCGGSAWWIVAALACFVVTVAASEPQKGLAA